MTGAGPYERLDSSRSALVDLISDLERELIAIAEATAESPDDEHDSEGSTIGYERARVGALLSEAQRSLAEVERALERLGAGEYGRCERCGAAISDERLAALPATSRCVGCAALS